MKQPVGRPNAQAVPAVASLPPPARIRRKPTSDTASVRFVEVVHFYLHDVGRSIDLKKVVVAVPAHDDIGIAKRRDTPVSMRLPKALVLQLDDNECEASGHFDCFSAQAKLYEDGVISIIIRVKLRLPFGLLHTIRQRTVVVGGKETTIAAYAQTTFERVYAAVGSAIDEPRSLDEFGQESYTAYCLLDCPEDPAVFLERNRDYVAALLIGEESSSELHQSQIAATLGQSFSYHRGELAVFDMDRCIIIDAAADYEDLLLIIENANYQLLELRVLDRLLDEWLSRAETDVRTLYLSGQPGRRRRVSAQLKFAHIQALRFDALFILENIENSSKIIGDYYLGQIYGRLCSIFNTDGWMWSIERRLETLQNVYEMMKTDSAEKRMLALEITFIAVCIILPIFQIIQVMIQ